MDADFAARHLRASVGALATFRLGPASGGAAPRWRAEVGRQWHERLGAEARAAPGPVPLLEVPLRGRLPAGRWVIEAEGRADQLHPAAAGGPARVREVKTVAGCLPLSPAEARARWPEYFHQAALYAALLAGPDAPPGPADLLLLDLTDEVRQVVPLTEGDFAALRAHLETVAEYGEERRGGRERLLDLPARNVFPVLRPGQAEAVAALAGASVRAPIVFVEAPTGFGKTGLALDFALRGLRDGRWERVVYLTGKSTGQLQVAAELERALAGQPAPRRVYFRNRAEHRVEGPLHTCRPVGCAADAPQRWRAAGLRGPLLFAAGPAWRVEAARELGLHSGVCPYEVSKAALPWAEFWLGDYHYAFAPRHGLFLDEPTFAPARSLLIVDEAHHLPERAADAWSAELAGEAVLRAAYELRDTRVPAKLAAAVRQLADALGRIRPCERLDEDTEADLTDRLVGASDALRGPGVPWDELTLETLEALWTVLEAERARFQEGLVTLLWAPAKGVARVQCLDAAPEIAARLRRCGQVLLLSATPGPPELFRAALGLGPAEGVWVPAAAPWRDGAYRVGVDLRADTRLRARAASLPVTTRAVAEAAAGATGPVAVFLPSHAYAETLAEALGALAPGLRLALPERGRPLDEQAAWLAAQLDFADVLLLVLGGSFAEAVDALGGRVARAVVVGPALPEPNAEARAREAALAPLGRAEVFRRVFAWPGLRKVNQALGRLVRAPGQSVRVLLHCRRFAEPAYADLLDPAARGGPLLASDGDAALFWRGALD